MFVQALRVIGHLGTPHGITLPILLEGLGITAGIFQRLAEPK